MKERKKERKKEAINLSSFSIKKTLQESDLRTFSINQRSVFLANTNLQFKGISSTNKVKLTSKQRHDINELKIKLTDIDYLRNLSKLSTEDNEIKNLQEKIADPIVANIILSDKKIAKAYLQIKQELVCKEIESIKADGVIDCSEKNKFKQLHFANQGFYFFNELLEQQDIIDNGINNVSSHHEIKQIIDELSDIEKTRELFKEEPNNPSITILKEKLKNKELAQQVLSNPIILKNYYTIQAEKITEQLESLKNKKNLSIEEQKQIEQLEIGLSLTKISANNTEQIAKTIKPKSLSFNGSKYEQALDYTLKAANGAFKTSLTYNTVTTGVVALATHGVLWMPIPGLDAIFLTGITNDMAKHITKDVYGYSNVDGIATFTSVLLGAVAGGQLAGALTSTIPGLGIVTGPATVWGLHAVTGIILSLVMDAMNEGKITDKDLKYLQDFNSIIKIIGPFINGGARSINMAGASDAFSHYIDTTIPSHHNGSVNDAIDKFNNVPNGDHTVVGHVADAIASHTPTIEQLSNVPGVHDVLGFIDTHKSAKDLVTQLNNIWHIDLTSTQQDALTSYISSVKTSVGLKCIINPLKAGGNALIGKEQFDPKKVLIELGKDILTAPTNASATTSLGDLIDTIYKAAGYSNAAEICKAKIDKYEYAGFKDFVATDKTIYDCLLKKDLLTDKAYSYLKEKADNMITELLQLSSFLYTKKINLKLEEEQHEKFITELYEFFEATNPLTDTEKAEFNTLKQKYSESVKSGSIASIFNIKSKLSEFKDSKFDKIKINETLNDSKNIEAAKYLYDLAKKESNMEKRKEYYLRAREYYEKAKQYDDVEWINIILKDYN